MHTHTYSQVSGSCEPNAMMTFTEEDDIDELKAIDDLVDEEEWPIIPIRPVSHSFHSYFFTPCQATQDGIPCPLLPPLTPQCAGHKCFILDLNETLLHSSFKVCLYPCLIYRQTYVTYSLSNAWYHMSEHHFQVTFLTLFLTKIIAQLSH